MLLAGLTLLVCSAWDIATRTIPGWVLVTLWGLVSIVSLATMTPLSMLGLLAGYGGAWLAALPGGDRKALALVGSILGPEVIVPAQLFAYSGLVLVVLTVGERRSIIGAPFFPWLALAIVLQMVLLKWV